MPAERIADLLPDYLRDKLGPDQRRRVTKAIEADPTLAREYRELRAYYDSLGLLTPLKAPPGFTSAVIRRIDKRHRGRTAVPALAEFLSSKLTWEGAGVLVTAMVLIVIFQPQRFWRAPLVEKVQPAVQPRQPQTVANAPAVTQEPPAGHAKEEESVPPAKSEARTRALRSSPPAFAANDDRLAKPEAKKSPPPAPAVSAPAERPAGDSRAAAAGLQQLAAAPFPATAAPFADDKAAPPEAAGMLAKKDESARAPAPASAAQAPAAAQSEMQPVQLALVLMPAKQELESRPVDYAKMSKRKEMAPARSVASAEVMSAPAPRTSTIEDAVRGSGGRISRVEKDKPAKGVTRYTIEIPASAYDGLATALAGLGKLSVLSESPLVNTGGSLTVIVNVNAGQ